MIDFSKFLKENLNGIFTTVEDGKPKSRVFQFLFADGKKVYFCTENNKAVFRQIKENPNVSFCAHKADFSYVLSICGKATFVNDINLKARTLDEYPALKEMFKTPNNPILELFYVDVEEVDTFDFVNGSKKEKI
ncbi:pyridoxamine 5'-phosphate oxidase family protein [Fusobacterium animalis]|uniref:pyridoxamine 5'-phosphate oxidase family protein n=1 Tax=Fusobacterium animalis TaxID=76859 RepID=UPI0030CC19A2